MRGGVAPILIDRAGRLPIRRHSQRSRKEKDQERKAANPRGACVVCVYLVSGNLLMSRVSSPGILHSTFAPAYLSLPLCSRALSFAVHLPAATPSSQVKGKTSKVDVFSPSLATDVAAALTLPSPLRASRAAGLSPVAAAGTTAVAMGRAGSAPVPLGVILGGIGGGGIRMPPSPLAPVPLPPFFQPEGLSVAGVPAPAGGVGSVLRRILRDDSVVSPSLDDSKRYRLESPRKGTWQGWARRGSGASTDGSSGGKSHFDGCRF